MVRVYIASKAKHWQRWRDLRWPGVKIISSWIHVGAAGAIVDWERHWQMCVDEAAGCDALITYINQGEVFKGALVEVGAALAHGVPVFATGFGPEHTWLNHPRVFSCRNLDHAFDSAVRHRFGMELRE